MVTGEGLDPWGWAPWLRRLVLVGLLLRADRVGRQAYGEMIRSPEFSDPIRWDDIDLDAVDGLLLPVATEPAACAPTWRAPACSPS